jgi:hypothetical protein
MKKKSFFILSFLSLLCWRCQYQIEPVAQNERLQFLVITAELTQTFGRIAIERSSGNASGGDIPAPASYLQGIAYVLDSKGLRTNFTLDGAKNQKFQGKVGESYQLFIETEGRKYQSQVEILPAGPVIDTITTEFNINPTFAPITDKYYGYDVKLNTKDLPEKGNFYQWEWVHYQRKEYCAFLADWKSWDNRVKGVPCYEDCFVVNYNPDLILLSDELVNGNPIHIPIDRVGFFTPPNKYYLKIEQRSITQNAYTYFNAILQQTQRNGNQYDVAPQTVFSTNITCTTNPEEKVLGVFNVFSLSKRILLIDRSIDIPNATRTIRPPSYELYELGPREAFPFFPGCGDETRYNTKYMPEGWAD